MSYKNLKLNTWTHPTTGAVRVYVDARFVEGRAFLSHADGVYLFAAEDGSIDWRCGWKQGPWNVRKSEMAHLAVTDERDGLMDHIACGGAMPTFAELLERISACQTKGGHFSYAQYEKKFCPAKEAA